MKKVSLTHKLSDMMYTGKENICINRQNSDGTQDQ